jgi:hypothetical protein
VAPEAAGSSPVAHPNIHEDFPLIGCGEGAGPGVEKASGLIFSLDNNNYVFYLLSNMRTFTTPEAAKSLGVSRSKFIDWCERGIIFADVQEASGHASRRQFSNEGILRAGLAFALKDRFGIPRDLIKNIVNSLWLRGFFIDWQRGEGGYLSILNPHDPEKFSWIYLPPHFSADFKAWWGFLKGGEAILLIDLYAIKKRIDEGVAAVF